MKKFSDTLVDILFYIYLAVLILFVSMKFTGDFNTLLENAAQVRALRREGTLNANFELFKTIKVYLKLVHSSNGVYLKNLIGNVIPFIPMGLFEASRYRFKAWLYCLFIIVTIEFVQLISGFGYFDVDDIFLNMIGCIIGFIVYGFFRNKNK